MTVPQLNNFGEVTDYLERFHDYARTKYDLVNMRRLMEYLGNPQNSMQVVHVAGTSGKTSTAYYMSALLTATGKKTGLTTSPHINLINERVQINGQPLNEEVFCAAMSEFLGLLEEAPVQPSWFELIVAFAYWYFERENVDYAVIEVGLGGLKDGTNVIRRSDKVCIVTDIGYDHVNVLGNTLAEIAAQKAGIIQPGNSVFTYKQAPEIMQVIENAASAQKAKLHVVEPVENPEKTLPDYQFRNGYLAYEVYQFLKKRDGLEKLNDMQLQKVRELKIPGRMEVLLKQNKTIILDGAHNAQKIVALVGSFRKLYPDQTPAIMISLKQGKDYEQVVPILAELSDYVVVTGFELAQDIPVRSMDINVLAEEFKKQGVKEVYNLPDQTDALAKLIEAPHKTLLVTGSLYMLGQLRNNKLV